MVRGIQSKSAKCGITTPFLGLGSMQHCTQLKSPSSLCSELLDCVLSKQFHTCETYSYIMQFTHSKFFSQVNNAIARANPSSTSRKAALPLPSFVLSSPHLLTSIHETLLTLSLLPSVAVSYIFIIIFSYHILPHPPASPRSAPSPYPPNSIFFSFLIIIPPFKAVRGCIGLVQCLGTVLNFCFLF